MSKLQKRSFNLRKPQLSLSKTGREVNSHAQCKQKNVNKKTKTKFDVNFIWLVALPCIMIVPQETYILMIANCVVLGEVFENIYLQKLGAQVRIFILFDQFIK